jgi:2-polyprenyl-3-methyl-5-hydroxy-6-metoxy-1,4-benzoquinol methylase
LLINILNRIWPRGAVSINSRTPSPEQTIASAYWSSCTSTFHGPPDYYQKTEQVLIESVLPLIAPGSRVLDAGCGNGRFTAILARRAANIDAFDISPALVDEARRSALAAGLTHVHFEVGDLAAVGRRKGTYDVVSCMGVISTIIDDWLFDRIVKGLVSKMRVGGCLISRDSLSTEPDGQLVSSDSYATRYRNEASYDRAFESAGLIRVAAFDIAQFGSYWNRIFVYRRAR